ALLPRHDPRTLWSPTAFAYVAWGMCIGLLVGGTQVILKEAWIKEEAGVYPGRELILSKERTSIGRSDLCDLWVNGDPSMTQEYAAIVLRTGEYWLENTSTAVDTSVNDKLLRGSAILRSGDWIRVGGSVFCFLQRHGKHTHAGD